MSAFTAAKEGLEGARQVLRGETGALIQHLEHDVRRGVAPPVALGLFSPERELSHAAAVRAGVVEQVGERATEQRGVRLDARPLTVIVEQLGSETCELERARSGFCGDQ